MQKAARSKRIRAFSKGHGPGTPLNQRARPTPERLFKSGGYFERGDSGQLTMRDSPLEQALARNLITPEQYAAGQKYRHHWYHAGLCESLVSADLMRLFRWEHSSFPGMPHTENQVFHRQRYREAVQVVGKIGSHVLESTVCREISLQKVGNSLGWSNDRQAYAAAVEQLKNALDSLCKLSGLGVETDKTLSARHGT